MTSTQRQIVRQRLSTAMLSIKAGSRAAALLEDVIGSLEATADLRANQSDPALEGEFLTATKGKVSLRDLGITWQPANVDIRPLMGLFAYSNSEVLPGIASLTINHTTNREGYDFENNSDDHPLETISFPNLESMTERGYISIAGFTNLTACRLPSLTVLARVFLRNLPAIALLDIPKVATFSQDISLSIGIVHLTCPAATTARAIHLECPNLQSISMPLLTTADRIEVQFTTPPLSQVDLSSLETCPSIEIASCAELAEINLPRLQSINNLHISNCETFASISIPVLLPPNGATLNFSDCALTAAAVNHVLARCVASSEFVSGVVGVNNGTNAAPTGQGILDAATLTDRGVTVFTN